MTTTATAPTANSTRNQKDVAMTRTYPISYRLASRADGTETFYVPTVHLTMDEVKALVADVKVGGVHALWCEVCGDLLDHCPDFKGLNGLPSDDEWPMYVVEAQTADPAVARPYVSRTRRGPA